LFGVKIEKASHASPKKGGTANKPDHTKHAMAEDIEIFNRARELTRNKNPQPRRKTRSTANGHEWTRIFCRTDVIRWWEGATRGDQAS
jgi:hypothetical protein